MTDKKFKTITAKTVFKNDERVTVPSTFSKKALEQLRIFHKEGLENGLHSLDEAEFIGWMSAVGVMALTKGQTEEKKSEGLVIELSKDHGSWV